MSWLGGQPPLVLFAAMAAGLTAWRGLGPGMLASSLGAVIGGSLFIHPLGKPGVHAVPYETLML